MNTLHERIEKAVKQRLAVAQVAESRWSFTMTTGTRFDTATSVAEAFAHIAANDPARIIRDCTEDLWLLEQHAPVNGMAEPDPAGEYCARCSHLNQIGEPYPCPNLLSLARRYDIPTEATP